MSDPTMPSIRLFHIALTLAALLLQTGCRDRFLSTSYEVDVPAGNRILYTDLDRKVIVSTTLEGAAIDVMPAGLRTGPSGDAPLLDTQPRNGLMVIESDEEGVVRHTVRRLDGGIPGGVRQIGAYPEEYVPGTFTLADDASWYAMFTRAPDPGGGSDPVYYLRTGSLADDRAFSTRISDAEHVPILAPRFSPDGTRLVFMDIWGDWFLELVTVGVDGRNRRPCMGDVVLSDTARPRFAWSPDGDTIAFAGFAENWISLIDSRIIGEFVHIDTRPFSYPRDMSWSPDGTKLLFSASIGTNVEICVLDVETRAIRNISNTGGDRELVPQWSPDGSLIACVVAGGTDAVGRPAVYDPTLGSRRLYPGRTSAVFWAR